DDLFGKDQSRGARVHDPAQRHAADLIRLQITTARGSQVVIIGHLEGHVEAGHFLDLAQALEHGFYLLAPLYVHFLPASAGHYSDETISPKLRKDGRDRING